MRYLGPLVHDTMCDLNARALTGGPSLGLVKARRVNTPTITGRHSETVLSATSCLSSRRSVGGAALLALGTRSLGGPAGSDVEPVLAPNVALT